MLWLLVGWIGFGMAWLVVVRVVFGFWPRRADTAWLLGLGPLAFLAGIGCIAVLLYLDRGHRKGPHYSGI